MTEAPQTRTKTGPTVVASAEPTPAARAQQAAAEAAGRVGGVHELGTAGGRALVRAMGRVPGGRTTYGPGVSIEVGQGKAALDVALVAEYGTPVPALAERVRDAVRERVEREADLEVVEVNVTVLDVHHPDDDIAAAQRAEVAERARSKAQGVAGNVKDAAGRAQGTAQDAAERARGVAQDAAERAQGVAEDASARIRDVARGVADQAGDVSEDGRRRAAVAVRDADEAVQRIAAQAAEAAAEQEGAVDRDQSDRASATNRSRNDAGATTVVLRDATVDGPGPEVVVADQVVVADHVVVVEQQDDEQGDRKG